MNGQDCTLTRWTCQLSVGCFALCTYQPQPLLKIWTAESCTVTCMWTRISTYLLLGLALKHHLLWKFTVMWLRLVSFLVAWLCLLDPYSFILLQRFYLRFIAQINIQTIFACVPWLCFCYFPIIKLPFRGALNKINSWSSHVFYLFLWERNSRAWNAIDLSSAQAAFVEASVLSDKLAIGWIHLIMGKHIMAD